MLSCQTKTNDSLKNTALQWPWILLNVSLYAFAIPWMLSAIVHQYFISKDYDSTLPGLGDTAARTFFISAHMGLGLICMLMYPLQFVPFVRRRFPIFHRWSGRISLLAAIFTSICGMVFICLKKFHLVGGINMGVAFFIYGIVFCVCAVMAGYFARRREFHRHKNWAIRSYSQILASMMYRYYYAVLGGFGVVYSPDQSGGLYCDEMDVCDYFLKPFDAIHAWTFFLIPLLFAEAVVYLLRDPPSKHVVERPPLEDTYNAEQAATNEEENQQGTDIDDDDKGKSESQTTSYQQLNLFGIIFGFICLSSTIFIYVTNALGINTFSV